jgi:hypothetical protein
LIPTSSPAKIIPIIHPPKPTPTLKRTIPTTFLPANNNQDNTSDDELEIPTKPDDDSTEFTPVSNKRTKDTTTPRQVRMATPDDMEEDTAPGDPAPTPEEPTPTDNNRDCRYSVILYIPPSTELWKVFTDLLKQFLKSLQEQTSKKLHIVPWDPKLAEDTHLIKKPSDFPEGSAKNRKKSVTYFSGYLNPKRGKPSKVYLKVRFVTKAPNDVPFPLTQLGQELLESIKEEMTVSLAKTRTHAKPSKSSVLVFFWVV